MRDGRRRYHADDRRRRSRVECGSGRHTLSAGPDDRWPGARRADERHRELPRYPVCEAPGGVATVGSAATSRALERRSLRRDLWQLLPAAARTPLTHDRRGRGLPVHQRPAPRGPDRRREAPGLRLHPWRRFRLRLQCARRAGPAGPARRHHRRHDELSSRRARLPRRARADGGERGCRRFRAARPAARTPLGARQHRRLRR